MKRFTLYDTPFYSVMAETEAAEAYAAEETRKIAGFESYSRDEWTTRTHARFLEVSAECDTQLATDFSLNSAAILNHHAARLGLTREEFERLRRVQA